MTHRRALSGGVERGTNERPGIWSFDLWANERLEINFTGRGRTYIHTYRHTDGHRDSMTDSTQWADSMKKKKEEKNYSNSIYIFFLYRSFYLHRLRDSVSRMRDFCLKREKSLKESPAQTLEVDIIIVELIRSFRIISMFDLAKQVWLV